MEVRSHVRLARSARLARSRALALVVAAAGAAGLAALTLSSCATGGDPIAVAGAGSTVRSALRRLPPPDPEAPVSEAERVRQVRFVAEHLAQFGLTPAAGGQYLRSHPDALLADSARAHVMGYLPGRSAGERNDLVVIAADLEGPAAAALLAAAQQLARRAVYENVPGPTVLVAFWTPPRTGAQGFADFAVLPGWLPSHIRRVVYVSADTTLARSRAALAPLGDVDLVAVPPPADARAGSSTLAAMLQARETEAVLRWALQLTAALADTYLAATPE